MAVENAIFSVSFDCGAFDEDFVSVSDGMLKTILQKNCEMIWRNEKVVLTLHSQTAREPLEINPTWCGSSAG